MKNMISKIYVLAFALGIIITAHSCKGMYDNIEPYSEATVYPAKYDTIISKIGFERVELDLMKVGRIKSSQIVMGKSKKTVIEYDDTQIIIDSLVSWVNIKDLKQSKLYRIKVFTIDEFNNKSVPQEIAVIPYTTSDLANLVVASPRILMSPNSAVIDWTSSLTSILLTYKSLNFEYTDKSGTRVTGERLTSPRIFAANLQSGAAFKVDIKYNVVPKVGGKEILDSVQITQPVNITMPTGSTTFNPAEKDILISNGVTTFTADAVGAFTKLTFPVHTNTLQDLFYFGNIQELDLTGGNIFQLTTLSYNANGVSKVIGGGSYLPFIRKVSPITNANAQTMVDLLNLGLIKKVKYARNSMGIDHLLAPFDKNGVIEWVDAPNETLIPMNYFTDGKIQATSWAMEIENPTNSAPAGSGITNPFKTILSSKNGSFAFSLPKEYRFNIPTYRYLKFKVYTPSKDQLSGSYSVYQYLWPRIMNYMWSYTSESTFGQELWNTDKNNFKVDDADLGKWKDMTIDLSSMVDKHSRVVVINIGGEPSLTFNPPTPMVYYFSNFRFSK